MSEEAVKAGQTLWKRGDIVKDVILIGEPHTPLNPTLLGGTYMTLPTGTPHSPPPGPHPPGEGKFFFKELPQTEAEPFQPGALLVDVYSLEHRKPHRLTFCAQTEGKVFRIQGSDILEFLDNNPGAFIWMRDTLMVE